MEIQNKKEASKFTGITLPNIRDYMESKCQQNEPLSLSRLISCTHNRVSRKVLPQEDPGVIQAEATVTRLHLGARLFAPHLLKETFTVTKKKEV